MRLLKTHISFATTLLLVFSLSACDTYTLFPTRSRTAPPTGGSQAGPPPSPPRTTREYSPDVSEQMRALQAQVQALERRVAELEGTESPPAVSLKPPARPKMETPYAPPSPPTVSPDPPAKPEMQTAYAPPPKLPPAPQVENKTFSEAMRLYRKKNFNTARNKFYQYLQNQPRGPKAAEARYYLGDSFFQENKYREAAVEFNKLVNLYPKSVLAPSALLRQAMSYQQMQQRNNYQITLKKIVIRYPDSPEAREAQKRLREPAR